MFSSLKLQQAGVKPGFGRSTLFVYKAKLQLTPALVKSFHFLVRFSAILQKHTIK